jgi:asparagine synthase (glutamine-hydrolysing)
MLRLDGTPVDSAPLEAMTQALFHRGPDAGHVVADGPCALGNRRLSILDLSASADLPLTRGAITLAYNGEVYNFAGERETLQAKGYEFTTHGDTEVVIALYREYGEAFVDHLSGMYAFALWDGERRQLLLGRDPAGKKPLYYWLGGDQFVFGSELKSVLLHPAVPRKARRDMLPLLLTYGYAPTPDTCFQDIHALPPGQLARVADGRFEPCARTYGVRLTGVDGPDDDGDWPDRILEALRAAVRDRMVSDVPLGAFLSGGVDSSLIVALMVEQAAGRVRTFSIGFEGDASFDETAYAKQVADLLGTEHTAFVVDPPRVADLLPRLVWHHDQPFGDSSAIPTLTLCELARKHVTVALGGDAGDELFAGYERFNAARLASTGWRAWPLLRPVYATAAALCRALPQGTGYRDRARRAVRFFDCARLGMPDGYLRLVRLATDELLDSLLAHPPAVAPRRHFAGYFDPADTRSWTTRIVDVNYRTYLLDDLLVKADRMSMAASLEVRSPFLDPRLIALASRIPTASKLRGGRTKHILKEAARRLLPDAIVDRAKHGFGVPVGEWFRGPLREWVHDLLLSEQAAARGDFKRAGLEALLAEHTGGRRDHGHVLWTLVTLEQWYRMYIDPPAAPSGHHP